MEKRQAAVRFIAAMEGRKLSADSPVFRRHLAVLLEAEGMDLQGLARTATEALKSSPAFGEMLTDADRLDAAAIQVGLPGYLETLDDPLVHRLLRRTFLCDLSFERLLTAIRRACLRREDEPPGERCAASIRVLVSLACQCFNNEYVYAAGDEEEAALERLKARLGRTIGAAGESLPTEGLAVFAMYAPLWTLGVSDFLLGMPALSVDPDLRELLTRQVREPGEEEEIQKSIPSFAMSGEPVTEAVRRQYEESPYPRWLDMTQHHPVPFGEALCACFPFLGRLETRQPVRILVAGCGTGQHPIAVATKYANVQVVACDISKASLAYGIRQARRYGVSNIEFVHGDILNLDRLGRQFDVVECIGVLHHLAHPRAGLRALERVLVPGGYMKIGVYSRRARVDLLEARAWIARHGALESARQVRKIRQEILAKVRAKELGGQPLDLGADDLYSLSGFRDMLCHTHQVEFTPAELSGVLGGMELSFLGYRGVTTAVRAAYAERFPMDPYLRDLERVEEFESEHPNLFGGLQVFWLAKKG